MMSDFFKARSAVVQDGVLSDERTLTEVVRFHTFGNRMSRFSHLKVSSAQQGSPKLLPHFSGILQTEELTALHEAMQPVIRAALRALQESESACLELFVLRASGDEGCCKSTATGRGS